MLLAMKSLARKKIFQLLSQFSLLFLKELLHFSSYILEILLEVEASKYL